MSDFLSTPFSGAAGADGPRTIVEVLGVDIPPPRSPLFPNSLFDSEGRCPLLVRLDDGSEQRCYLDLRRADLGAGVGLTTPTRPIAEAAVAVVRDYAAANRKGLPAGFGEFLKDRTT